MEIVKNYNIPRTCVLFFCGSILNVAQNRYQWSIVAYKYALRFLSTFYLSIVQHLQKRRYTHGQYPTRRRNIIYRLIGKHSLTAYSFLFGLVRSETSQIRLLRYGKPHSPRLLAAYGWWCTNKSRCTKTSHIDDDPPRRLFYINGCNLALYRRIVVIPQPPRRGKYLYRRQCCLGMTLLFAGGTAGRASRRRVWDMIAEATYPKIYRRENYAKYTMPATCCRKSHIYIHCTRYDSIFAVHLHPNLTAAYCEHFRWRPSYVRWRGSCAPRSGGCV